MRADSAYASISGCTRDPGNKSSGIPFALKYALPHDACSSLSAQKIPFLVFVLEQGKDSKRLVRE